MAHANILTAQASETSLSSRIAGHVRQAWQHYWTQKTRRAAVLALRTLDDRTLKDIGIDRSEIESVVYTRGDDAGRHRVGICRQS